MTTTRIELTAKDVRRAMLGYLRARGLTQSDAKKLGLKGLTAVELKKRYPELARFPFSGFIIPYYDRRGKETKFRRYRYLEEFSTIGCGDAKTEGRFRRYTQRKGDKPRVYFPPNFPWKDFFTAPPSARRLIITEGELKAAAACKHGIPAIALGGVWNFRCPNVPLVEDLASLPLEGFDIYICYDSDRKDNPLVQMAESALARELMLLRPRSVSILRLPALQADLKTGLDDYLAAAGKMAKEKFEELLGNPDAVQPPGVYDIRDRFFERALAEQFVEEHLDRIRYLDTGDWMVCEGGRWSRDRAAVKYLLGEFLKAQLPPRRASKDVSEKEANAIHQLRKSLSTAHFAAAVLEIAAGQPCIQMRYTQFDSNPNVLGLPGGKVVELQTGHTRAAEAEDLVSRSVTTLPGQGCPRWLTFLDQITNHDRGLIAFLRRLAGYCLTASVREEILPTFYGPGGNGKGTFWETVSKIMGNVQNSGYATEFPMESLVAQRFSNDYSVQNDVARLCGARLAVSDEGDKHRRMNTDLVKRLTGGGNLVGKLMCKDKFEFAPTHKLVPLMNHQTQNRR